MKYLYFLRTKVFRDKLIFTDSFVLNNTQFGFFYFIYLAVDFEVKK